jgi:hypothetical protein
LSLWIEHPYIALPHVKEWGKGKSLETMTLRKVAGLITIGTIVGWHSKVQISRADECVALQASGAHRHPS